MIYTNIRSAMKWLNPHTQNLKCFSSAKFYEHNNKFGKRWSPGYEFIPGTNISTLPTLNIDLSYHPFIKYDIFEVSVNLPPRGNPIGIVVKYCEHHNMSYIYQSTNNSPCTHVFPYRNRTTFCILGVVIK